MQRFKYLQHYKYLQFCLDRKEPRSTKKYRKQLERAEKDPKEPKKRQKEKERYPKFKAGNALLGFISQESFEGGLRREINTLLILVEKD